jgi:hypothetical protein
MNKTSSVVQWSEFLATDPEVRVRFPEYRILWEAVGLERDPLILVNTIQELLGWKSGLENREYGCRDPSCWSRGILSPQKLALASLTSGGRSVGIVRLRTQATEFRFWSISSSVTLEITSITVKLFHYRQKSLHFPILQKLIFNKCWGTFEGSIHCAKQSLCLIKHHTMKPCATAANGSEVWSATLSMLENIVLARTFGPKRDEVSGGFRKLYMRSFLTYTLR